MSTPVHSGYNDITPHPRSVLSRSFVPLALITLGVVFLLGNLVPGPGRGGLILLGLGAAFAIGRLTTARYGYSVPAGILIAIGAYVSLQQTTRPGGTESAGWFFLLLGSGFVLSYLIGMRPAAIWPLFPAAALICLGLVLFGWASLGPIAGLSWIAGYWPAALVLFGLWLMFRDHLPPATRAPVATLGGIVLLGYGILAAIASIAAAGELSTPGFMARFGAPPFNDEITLDQPISAGDTFIVSNSSGRTVIHGGSGNSVHVIAKRHYWVDNRPPTVQLTPRDRTVALELSDMSRPALGPGTSVDFEIELPTGVQVNAESSSGRLEIADIDGPVQARASSGAIMLKNISGELRASASSGDIRGTELRHVREVQTSSGAINLQGIFTDAAQIRASSGGVQLTFMPGSAVGVEVRTSSGAINQRGGLQLANQRNDRNSLSGTLGAATADTRLQIQTSSGSVTLSQ